MPDEPQLPEIVTVASNERRDWTLTQRLEDAGVPLEATTKLAASLEFEIAPGHKIAAHSASEMSLRRGLGRVGINKTGKKGADALLRDHGLECVRWQLALWPLRDESDNQGTNRAGALINRILGDDPPPPVWLEAILGRIAAQERDEAARVAQEAKEREKAAENAAIAPLVAAELAQNEWLDQMFEELDPATKERIAEVTRLRHRQMAQGVVNGLPPEPSRVLRRQVMREILAQDAGAEPESVAAPPNRAEVVNGARARLLGRAYSGAAELDDLDAHRESVAGELDDDEWKEIKAAVVERMSKAA